MILEEEKMFQEKNEQVLYTDIGFAQDLIGTLTISLSANPLYEPLRSKLRGKEPT